MNKVLEIDDAQQCDAICAENDYTKLYTVSSLVTHTLTYLLAKF